MFQLFCILLRPRDQQWSGWRGVQQTACTTICNTTFAVQTAMEEDSNSELVSLRNT